MKTREGNLEERAYQVRRQILYMAARGGCYVGAAFSCVELLVYLYSSFLRISPSLLDNPGRDYFFLSKGHAVPALYGTLREVGLLEKGALTHYLKPGSKLYWHPNRELPGVESYSGSLGHGLPLAVGAALDCKLHGSKSRVVVLTGDGELNEGSNWEACLVAKAYQLDNLMIIVDRNRIQANERTEALLPLEPLVEKFSAFGCAVVRASGHSFPALEDVFSRFPLETGKASVIVADTVRGKGLPHLEDRVEGWFLNLDREKADQLRQELYRSKHYSVPGEEEGGERSDDL